MNLVSRDGRAAGTWRGCAEASNLQEPGEGLQLDIRMGTGRGHITS